MVQCCEIAGAVAPCLAETSCLELTVHTPVLCPTSFSGVTAARICDTSESNGPIRANRFAIRTRIVTILCESILASRKPCFLRIDFPKNGIAARIGRESREFQCESEREDAIHANLAKCFKNIRDGETTIKIKFSLLRGG